MATRRFDTVVIGGSQAGLATGYHLQQQGRSFVILEGADRVGEGWRRRWDSLRLFTPAKFNGLPGLDFPADGWSFPTKDEMADYLEAYAEHFDLPVRTGVRVSGVSWDGDGYVVTAGDDRYEADNVVVATGAHQHGKVPSFADELDPSIVQIHANEYVSPSQLQDGPVLVVGLGNSGAEIAMDVVADHETFVSGQPTAQLPFEHGTRVARVMLPVIRFMGRRVLTRSTPIGRKAGPKLTGKATPLIRTKTKHLQDAGVEMVGRTTGARDGRPTTADGHTLDVANVIWATGFRYDFRWIDVPVFDDAGAPVHTRGVTDEAPGLYFVGLVFQYAVASDVITGVGKDAAYVAKHIARRSPVRDHAAA